MTASNDIARFRGLTLDTKQWVYGYLFKIDGRAFILGENCKIVQSGGCDAYINHFIEVSPESVGQFTTLFDKNKKEIYGSIPIDGKISKGGDILKWDRSKILSVVEWCVAGFTMKVNTPKGVRNYSMLNNYECIEPDMILDEHEVISNATEHPSLLKGDGE